MEMGATAGKFKLVWVVVALALGLPAQCHARMLEGTTTDAPRWDDRGYVLGCMCGGRFGNQFDSMLGFLSYAKAINRTAVVGPWVEYNAQRETGMYPYFPEFEDFFDLSRLAAYHRVIGMRDFLRHFGGVWEQVGVWGFSARGEGDFHDKYAPRGPFWRHILDQLPSKKFSKFQNFLVNDEDVGRLDHSAAPEGSHSMLHPVLALDCVPGSYPAPRGLDPLAAYFDWGGTVASKARAFMLAHFGDEPFVAVHFRNEFAQMGRLRHGQANTCESFSVVQCAEANGGSGQLPVAACMPTKEQAQDALRAQTRGVGARKVFLASDEPLERMLPALREALSEFEVVTLEGGSGIDGLYRPQLDLAILSMADAAIAHCPSSFSNVATRIRANPHAGRKALPTAYWGLPSTYLPPPSAGLAAAEAAARAEL